MQYSKCFILIFVVERQVNHISGGHSVLVIKYKTQTIARLVKTHRYKNIHQRVSPAFLLVLRAGLGYQVQSFELYVSQFVLAVKPSPVLPKKDRCHLVQ